MVVFTFVLGMTVCDGWDGRAWEYWFLLLSLRNMGMTVCDGLDEQT